MRPPSGHGGTHLLPDHLIPHTIIDNNVVVVDVVVTPLNVVSGETKLVYIFYQQKLFMLSCDAKIEKERGGRQREQKKQPDSIGDLPKLGFGILLFKLAFW